MDACLQIAATTIDRIIDVLPASQQNQIRTTLSEAIKGVIEQNLFRCIDKPGRVAALQILVMDTLIASMIRDRKTHQIPCMLEVGKKKETCPWMTRSWGISKWAASTRRMLLINASIKRNSCPT